MLTTYISILRGINVSGQKIIKMEALREMYSALGFKNVQTYIQSGNVFFQEEKTDKEKLTKRIAEKIAETFGFDVSVLMLEMDELREIIRANPFSARENKDTSRMYVTFLSSKPSKENTEKINGDMFFPEEFVMINKAIYLYFPEGYGNAKLSNNFFETKLKVSATTRNWRTTNELLTLAEKIANKQH